MRECRIIRFAIWVTLLFGLILIFSRPILPVDETRYVSVAWEMWHTESFLVPILNGIPYHHKPPLVFWLIHAGWAIFGVNEMVPRLIPLMFSLMDLGLVGILSRQLWPESENIGKFSALVLASCAVWAVYSTLVMFDVILTFWVLLAIVGIVMATDGRSSAWLVAGIALGFGGLTKGPVVLVHWLPMALLVPWWKPESVSGRPGSWFTGVMLSVAIGISIMLLWAVPAGIAGGPEFRNAIFWSQTVNRMVSSFAHQRPWWWYLPILPGLFFPWFFLSPPWRWRFTAGTSGERGCLVWLAGAVALFSLFSGKQLHYLLPELPAFAFLVSRDLENRTTPLTGRFWLALAYIALGGATVVFYTTSLGADIGGNVMGLSRASFVTVGAVMLAGVYQLPGTQEPHSLIMKTSLISLAFIVLLNWGAGEIWNRYDLKEISGWIRNYQALGRPVVYYGKYHGQFNFIGRLVKPLMVIRDGNGLRAFLKANPGAVVVEASRKKTEPGKTILYKQPYRGKMLLMWSMGEPASSYPDIAPEENIPPGPELVKKNRHREVKPKSPDLRLTSA